LNEKLTTAREGGGIVYDFRPVICTDIFRDNSSGTGNNENVFDDTKNPVIRFCDIMGGFDGNGNIDTNPDFLNTVNRNCDLNGGPPCINSCTDLLFSIYTATWYFIPELDIIGISGYHHRILAHMNTSIKI
jgi:hypothetical protein